MPSCIQLGGIVIEYLFDGGDRYVEFLADLRKRDAEALSADVVAHTVCHFCAIVYAPVLRSQGAVTVLAEVPVRIYDEPYFSGMFGQVSDPPLGSAVFYKSIESAGETYLRLFNRLKLICDTHPVVMAIQNTEFLRFDIV